MKHYHVKYLLPFFAGALVTIGISCQSNDELYQPEPVAIAASADYIVDQENVVTDNAPFPIEPAFAPVVAPLDPGTPLLVGGPQTFPLGVPFNERSQRFARSVFDDHSDIEPWLANYVGSYGVLPTRFGKAPFLYSFEVQENADIFNDDDLSPWHDGGNYHGDDDN